MPPCIYFDTVADGVPGYRSDFIENCHTEKQQNAKIQQPITVTKLQMRKGYHSAHN